MTHRLAFLSASVFIGIILLGTGVEVTRVMEEVKRKKNKGREK